MGTYSKFRGDKWWWDTVEWCYNAVQCSKILYKWLQEQAYQSDAGCTKDTTYLALTGKLWDVFDEYFLENWRCYNGTALYVEYNAHVDGLAQVRSNSIANTLEFPQSCSQPSIHVIPCISSGCSPLSVTPWCPFTRCSLSRWQSGSSSWL